MLLPVDSSSYLATRHGFGSESVVSQFVRDKFVDAGVAHAGFLQLVVSAANKTAGRLIIESENFLNEAIGFEWGQGAVIANMFQELSGGCRIRHSAYGA